jgi:hypothetical protein
VNQYLDRCRIVFLLGAGASVPLGMPTTRSLRAFLADKTRDGRIVGELYESAAYRFRVAASDINIEDLLEHLYEIQLLLWLARRSSLPTVLPKLSGNSRMLAAADDTLKRVQRRVYATLHRECGDCSGSRVHSLWHPILRFVASRQPLVPVFTLNYDWTFERLCVDEMKRYHLVDGFEPLGGTWDAARFLRTVPDPERVTIALFKLHGSTNWLPGGPTKSMGSFPLDTDDSGDGLPPRQFTLVYPGHAQEMWLGKEAWSRLNAADSMFTPWDQEEPYKTLHSYLNRAIGRAKLIVVIGYAFHDERVNGAIFRGLEGDTTLKVLVLDPGIRRSVRASGSTHFEAPFEYLKFGTSDVDWSRFYWLAAPFGEARTTSGLIKAIRGATAAGVPKRKARSVRRPASAPRLMRR